MGSRRARYLQCFTPFKPLLVTICYKVLPLVAFLLAVYVACLLGMVLYGRDVREALDLYNYSLMDSIGRK